MLSSKSTNPFKIFLSHSSKDRGFSAEIYEHLRCIGIPVWFSPVEMPPTGVWYTDEEIETKLRQAMEICDSALILVDDYALHSRWVNYEIKIAEEIVRKRPDFKLIPIINDYPKAPLPNHIQALNPIDFNRGYKTALRDMLNRLNLVGMGSSSVSTIGRAMVWGSRSLNSGINLQAHLEKLGLSNIVKEMIFDIRDYLAQFSYRPSIQEISRWLWYWSSEKSQINTLVEGNLWYSRIPTGDQYRVVYSVLPTATLSGELDNGLTPLLLLITLIDPGSNLDTSTTLSILSQYGQDGSAYFWVVFNNGVFRYSMGSDTNGSILLSENRLMGASQMVFGFENVSLDSDMQMWMQMMMNKLGQGMLQNALPQSPPYKDAGILSDLWERLKQEEWEFPQTTQNDSFWAHLTHGGMLFYEVSRETGISPTLSQQINVVLKSAGARIITTSGKNSRQINMSFSGLQSKEIAKYLGVDLIQLDDLAS